MIRTQEIIAAINNLPTDEKILLIEQILRSLREDIRHTPRAEPRSTHSEARTDTPITNKLHGLFATDAPATDEEIKEDYTRYLTEKHS